MEEHLEQAGFGGNFLIVQSTGGLFDVEDGAALLHPHAGIGSGCRRDRHQGAVRFDRHEERDRLRHGRHHRQGRRDLSGRRADDRRRADRRLRDRPADPDADDRHPGGRHRRRLDRAARAWQCVARRAGERRRRARSGLLWARRHRADHHRRQPGAGPARRRPLPRRRDAARHRSGEAGAQRQDREAARPRSRRGGGGHSPHRHHQDGACGALGDDRARPRCRRFYAGRLRRRRAAARLGGGARAWPSPRW